MEFSIFSLSLPINISTESNHRVMTGSHVSQQDYYPNESVNILTCLDLQGEKISSCLLLKSSFTDKQNINQACVCTLMKNRPRRDSNPRSPVY